MHERLDIDENASCNRFVWQIALVDDEQGLLVRIRDPQQPHTAGEVLYWNLRTGQLEPDSRAYPKAHTCRCISPNGRYQLIATRKQAHHVWDRINQQSVAKLEIPPAYGAAHLSDDAQTIALAGKQAAIWSAPSGVIRPLRKLKDGFESLAPSGKHLIGPPETSVYDAESCAKLFTFPGHAAFGAFSPDGRSFLHTYEYRAKLFDLETGEKRESLVAPFEIIGGALSPDQTHVAVGGIFQGVRVWKLPSEDIRATWKVRDRYIRRLRFSADCLRLATASDTGAIRFLDVEAGVERACLVLLSNDAWVTITPDGYFIGSENLASEARFQMDGKVVALEKYAKK